LDRLRAAGLLVLNQIGRRPNRQDHRLYIADGIQPVADRKAFELIVALN
jgi:hypothetical protein